ncbi:MAG: penicillin-binding transpeptidase domain-containing protein, partial [Legionellales bacterium]
LTKAVTVSCDTFFYVLSYRMGIDRMHEWMSQFGYGQKTGIDLPGEKSGLYPSPEWKLRARKAKWLAGETISLGIGQGYLLASPLQLVKAVSIIANQGHIVTPHLLLTSKGQTPFALPNKSEGIIDFRGTSQDWLNMREAMVDVVDHGTARRIGYGLSGYRIAGKTGTAQVVGIAQGKKYNEASLNHRQYDHALFTAFAPADDPQIAVAIIVENGKSGAGAAAPIARAMFDYEIHQRTKNPIRPELTPADNGLMTAGQPIQAIKTTPVKPAPGIISTASGEE